jgi:pimeloyl-ACP methyl ester carboxylesterase
MTRTITTVPPVHHRTTAVRGLTLAYREAGDPASPTVVLLHGFPTSSHMFRGLLEDLSGSWHVIAPDHVGFGASDAPPIDTFDYTFDQLAATTTDLIDQLGVDRFALYIQDYGAPIGLRIASSHPSRVTALVVQNGNAYAERLTPFWDGLRAFWADRDAHEAAVRQLLRTDDFRWQYTHGVPEDRLDRISPDTWRLDRAGVDRPGNVEVQLQLFWDYRTNLDAYPQFQAYLRNQRPPTLIVWGAHDEIFSADGARAYLRDLPDAELHLLDTGHFALETHREEIASLTDAFLHRVLR